MPSLRAGHGTTGVGFDCGFGPDSLGGHFRLRADNIDAALEVGAIVNADAGRPDVAHQTALFANGNLSVHFHVAVYLSENVHLAGLDVSLNLAIVPHGEDTLRFERALHVAIHHQFFLCADVNLDMHGRTDRC